jgi:hypothetical protein
MSKQTNKSNQANKSAVTPFCKFCKGAGESNEVYTSHWQFSTPKEGVLTCPKLLNHKCKNCDSKGHIEKRCPFPKQKKEQDNTTKFCRFCCNAKNPDFRSHNQFSEEGFVQCPILLEIECQNCGGKGHTKRYCSESVCKTLTVITSSPNEAVLEPRVVPRAPKKPANKFASLFVEEEDEEKVDTVQSGSLTEFPMLSGKQSTVSSMMGGWTKVVKSNPEPTRTRPATASRPAPQPETVIKCKEPEVQVPSCPTRPVPDLPSSPEPISDTEEEKPSAFVAKPVTSWADEEW